MNIKKIIVLTAVLSFFASSHAMRRKLYRGYNRPSYNRNNNNNRSGYRNYSKKKDYGDTLLHKAVYHGNLKEIEKYSDLILQKNNVDRTALHGAVFLKYGYDRVFQKLMSIINKEEYSAEKINFINAIDKKGATALHIAISKGRLEIAKDLIDAGADVTVADSDYQTALHKALLTTKIEKDKKRELRELVKKLLKDIKNEDKYNQNIVKELLSK